MKKIIAVVLVMSMSVLLFSCTGDKDNNNVTTTAEYVLPTPVVSADVSLPYTSADKIDPYASAGKLNRGLLPAIYEGLFYPTADGKGVPVLAESGDINGKEVTVKLKSGLKFSNGTEVLASDVKSSYQKAAASEYYSGNVKNIASVTVINNLTLKFTLSNVDAMALNSLSFPVAAAEKSSYIGTGKYSVSYLEGEPYLTVNKNHRDYSDKWNKQIALFDMAGISSTVYPFKANKITAYQNDLTDGEYINLSSKTVSVLTNKLVYAGLNMTWAGSATSIDWVRRVINMGIDRTSIAASSFLGQTEPTATPFKPEFYQLSGVDTVSLSGETERVSKILADKGYGEGGSTLSVTILVCSDNKYKVGVAESLAESLNTLGFSASVDSRKKEDYESALKGGKFSIYIGEIELSDNCDLTEFFSSKGTVNYGIDETVYDIYSSYKSGETTTTPFVENFYTNTPFIPLFYRKTVVSLNPNIKGVSAADCDIVSSVSDWQMS